MRRLGWCLIAFIWLAGSVSAQTKGLEGLDDPALQRAASAWLEGEDFPAIQDIATLARQGNSAARLFLSRLHTNRLWGPELAALPDDERRALFRDMSKRKYGKSWRSLEIKRGNPVAIALDNIGTIQSIKNPDEWLEHAEVLLSAGEREIVLRHSGLFITGFSNPDLAKFLEGILTLEDNKRAWVWHELISRSHLWNDEGIDDAEFMAKLKKKWPNDPWQEENEAAFQAALADERLEAIRVLGLREYLNFLPHNDIKLFDPSFIRISTLISWAGLVGLPKADRPTVTEMTEAGAILVAEAKRGNYLQPLMELCQRYCQQSLPLCMYSGTMYSGGLNAFDWLGTPLESVISQRRWLGSKRARFEVLTTIQSEHSIWKIEWLPKDQCFVDLLSADPAVELE